MKGTVWAVLSLPWLGGCGDAHPKPAPAAMPAAHVASATCSLKTPAAWQQFLQQAVDDESWVKTCEQTDCESAVGDFARHVQSDLLDVMAKCKNDLDDNPRIAACTQRLRRFIPAWQRQHATDSHGFEQSNHDYFAEQVAADAPPGMMDPPPELLAALPLRTDLETAAQNGGWPYLTHESCLGGVRTFVHVGDAAERFQQWFLFSIDVAQLVVPNGEVVSFIALEQRTADGKPLEPARIQFRDYVLAHDSAWHLTLPEDQAGKCYACHEGGMRQLLPNPGDFTASAPVRGEADYGTAAEPSAAGAERLARFNQDLLAYAVSDFGDSIALDDYGPPLGESLGCTHCHDGVTRGRLSVFTSQDALYQKVVEQLSMRAFHGTEQVPDQAAMALLDQQRNGELSPADAEALATARLQHQRDYNALMASRLPDWQAWVTATPCE